MILDFHSRIVLENSFVRLEPLSMEHHSALLVVAIRNELLLQYSPSAVNSPELLSSYISQALLERQNQIKYSFVIYDKYQKAFAGSTSFGNISNADRRLEIGWTWIGEDFQRTGLNRSCKWLLLSYAFETLEFERVEFKTDSRNLQSRKAIECIGATYEGEFRSHSVMSDGYRRNTVYYSILKNEWPKIKSTCFGRIS